MIHPIFDIQNYFWNPYAVPYFLVGILTMGEGIFVFLQNKKSLVHLSYMLSCAAVSLWLNGVGLIYNARQEAVALAWAKYFAFLGIIFITPTIYFFSVCWQTTLGLKEDARKSMRGALFNFFCGLLLYVLCVNSDLLVRGMWRYPWGFYPKAGPLYVLLIAWFFTLMVMLIRNFIYAYKKESVPIKKKQARLIIIAFSVAFIGSLEYLPNYGVALYLLAFVPVFFCITTVGYSIIRYRLMDIETVFHKTIGWLFTNIALLIPFVSLLYIARSWCKGLNFLGALGFLGSLLLIFLFFVKALHPKIDHFFQRRRYNLEEISARFTEDLVHLKGLAQLIQRIENVITDTLYPQHMEMFIRHEPKGVYQLANATDGSATKVISENDETFLAWLAKDNKIVYREFVDIDPAYATVREQVNDYFNRTEATVAIPLVLNDKLLGIINLGKKANLRRYNAMDFHFLTLFKNQATIAISNSLLYENIEEQVRQRTKELVELQKQLVQAEKLATVGTLAGGVAHEINNPLTAILTNVQMLLAEKTLDRESLELIEEATKRCRTIVQKLMLYAKKPLESAVITEVNLLTVVKNAVSFLSYQLEQENIRIITEATDDGYMVQGNQNELEQVVTNIVLNARDAIRQIKKGGDIRIGLSKNGEWIKMAVKDEGVGIPKEIFSKIFDPFFTTKDIGKGLGLGLSICQAIVEKHNGLIDVQSELNKGSVFTVQLPKAKEEAKSIV